uniref:SAM-dependent methyltransferase n=1 Tax=Eiseniibacteriota bacterium TaxID=2212470 RepID=A0A832MK59_UNCEI
MNQLVPAKGPGRARLREKGQFWTPTWVAGPMVSYALSGGARTLFDPAVGPGTFFVAARSKGFKGSFRGCELHAEALEQSKSHGLSTDDIAGITVGDFLTTPFPKVPAIVSNPPYIRHHRIPLSSKSEFQYRVRHELGLAIDGRAGLHVYFFIRCLQMLEPGGRLAFIVSADICEGVFAKTLWTWVTAHFCLDSVVTFSPEAAPFPGVDTNALIFLLRNDRPKTKFTWARVRRADPEGLQQLLVSLNRAKSSESIEVYRREVAEGIQTGLSRPPHRPTETAVLLKDVAHVMRGIATGANDFFVMTSAQAKARGLDLSLFVRCIGRTRDCPGDRITADRLTELEREGRPTWLLDVPDVPIAALSEPVRDYLMRGEKQGLPTRALIMSRRCWYRMEQRRVPPLLFAYLGRRSSRFILNEAGIVPLTGFLCVYPQPGIEPRALWSALNEPVVIEGLSRVGKSYGDGAIKVEPRSLEQLAIPCSILFKHGIAVHTTTSQLSILEPRQRYTTKRGPRSIRSP